MRRRAAKVDANQSEIVAAFRAAGASVAVTSSAGQGFPDLVVGYRGMNLLVEVKDGNKAPSERRLTKDQVVFQCQWRGQYTVIERTDQVFDLLAGVAA